MILKITCFFPRNQPGAPISINWLISSIIKSIGRDLSSSVTFCHYKVMKEYYSCVRKGIVIKINSNNLAIFNIRFCRENNTVIIFYCQIFSNEYKGKYIAWLHNKFLVYLVTKEVINEYYLLREWIWPPKIINDIQILFGYSRD